MPLYKTRSSGSGTYDSEFDFAGVNPNILIPDTKGFQIADRTSLTLDIISCTWRPVYCDIEVGLWNKTNSHYYYGTVLDGGSSAKPCHYNNLPGGTYRICVCNRGNEALEVGTIKSKISCGFYKEMEAFKCKESIIVYAFSLL